MPSLEISEFTHQLKYRAEGETYEDCCSRQAAATSDSEDHRKSVKRLLLEEKFLPGGRIQSAAGSPRNVTPFNCYVSGILEDTSESIMKRVSDSFQTMRVGGGYGLGFGRLRPKGERIVSLDSAASGPVSFMGIFDATCKTVSSAGHRRGALMGVLPVWHPDIEEFIFAKHNSDNLTSFNISVGITDEFMEAVVAGDMFDLRWGGRVYKQVDARRLWDKIMRSTWDWAEPGVLFIDTINNMNNLWYCEEIEATNPCAEQPLPPHGACLLGAFNLTQYVYKHSDVWAFDYNSFRDDIKVAVRMLDNVIDDAVFPLPEQREEAISKRRMGIGLTGLANAIEACGYSYGSSMFLHMQENIQRILRDEAYRASIELAKEKGAFPLFGQGMYMSGKFVQSLPADIKSGIREHGIRNSHLLTIAPTGTISLCADNVSSGIEPVFSHKYERTIEMEDGPVVVEVEDYGSRVFDVKGKTASEVTVDEHLAVLTLAQKYTDSAVSKTCNVGDDVTWDEFKNIYMEAWKNGAKGCTTFRASGKRFGILNVKTEDEPEACYIDPETGTKTCE